MFQTIAAERRYPMNTNSLMVLGQPGRFSRTSTQVARRAPVSPMVMQHFTQLLSNLNQKVNAIAVNQERAITARQVSITPMAKPIESREVEVKRVKSSLPESQRDTKVNRSRLLDFFD